MEFKHASILLDECIEQLKIEQDGIYMDGTLGGAGHSYHICQHLSPKGTLIGIDQDENAIAASTARLSTVSNRVIIAKNNYVHFESVLDTQGIGQVNGILLDLGVSSHQLDNGSRGFSYRLDAPLDRRMDLDKEMTAADIVNGYTVEQLSRIFRDYGEDPFAYKIALGIAKAREKKPIETTFELVDIIKSVLPAKVLRKPGHPAKQVFQSIRIELNSELDVLIQSIDRMIDRLAPGGRLCIITFHSLEDRIVKAAFRRNQDPCICPHDFPVCVCGLKSKGRVVTRKPIIASDDELEKNSRAKSAKLRVFERLEG